MRGLHLWSVAILPNAGSMTRDTHFIDGFVLDMKASASVAIDLACTALLFCVAQMITGVMSFFLLKRRSHRWMSMMCSPVISSISRSTCDQQFARSRSSLNQSPCELRRNSWHAFISHFSRRCSSIAYALIIGWKIASLFLSVSPLIVDILNTTIK